VVSRHPIPLAFFAFNGTLSDPNIDTDWIKFVREFVIYWKKWHNCIKNRYKSSQICFLQYEYFRDSPIDSVLPCIDFLGIEASLKMQKCLTENYLELNITKALLQDVERNKFLRKIIPFNEANFFRKSSKEISKALLEHSISKDEYSII
jgi:hypothetical protein